MIDIMVQNFQAIAINPTSTELYNAETWYDDANELAEYLTTLGDLTFDQACCIIAAFSIRQRWERNVELATRFARGERNLPVTGAVNRIAENIVAFDDPYSALNGPKTNAFAHNIAGDLESVTIDTWMIKAAGLDNKKSLTPKQYKVIAEALTLASQAGVLFGKKRVFLKPAQYQALVWIMIRGGAE